MSHPGLNLSADPKFEIVSSSSFLLAGCYCAVSIVAAFGNLGVILAFMRDKELQIPRFYPIFNLAICDLLRALILIPLAGIDVLSGGNVLSGACDGVILVAQVLFTETVYTVILISLDRYLLIRDPFKYIVTMTGRRMKLFVALTWIVAFALSIMLILIWPLLETVPWGSENMCQAAYEQSKYAIWPLTLEFLAYFGALAGLNIAIYINITKSGELVSRMRQTDIDRHSEPPIWRGNEKKAVVVKQRTYSLLKDHSFVFTESHFADADAQHLMPIICCAESSSSQSSSLVKAKSWPMDLNETRDWEAKQSVQVPSRNHPEFWPGELRRFSSELNPFFHVIVKQGKRLERIVSGLALNFRSRVDTTEKSNGPQLSQSLTVTNRTVHVRKNKIRRSLALLVGVYLLCWTPYTLGAIWNKAVTTGISEFAMRLLVLILYLDSALNPLLYGLSHKKFERNFRAMKTLCIHRVSHLCRNSD